MQTGWVLPCKEAGVFYWLVKAILGPFLRLVFRPWAEGTENVPREGPAIIASNHLSFSDHFFGPLPLPRKVIFLAKAEYFTGSGLKGLVSRAFFRGVGQIPMDRGGGKASCSASTPKAPAPRTVGSIAARPVSLGSRWNHVPR